MSAANEGSQDSNFAIFLLTNPIPISKTNRSLSKSTKLPTNTSELLLVAKSIDWMWPYTRFVTSSRQEATVETLLPLGQLDGADAASKSKSGKQGESIYEFFPSAESILEEVVPTSFKVKLFKCFLDAAVSEQIARMVAMKNATENANEMIKDLSRTYNRARQGQITGEIMEVIGGVEALEG